MAEGGGLLNRYTLVKAYRGFESLRLRQPSRGMGFPPTAVIDPAAATCRAASMVDLGSRADLALIRERRTGS